jgi:hypothetical protein
MGLAYKAEKALEESTEVLVGAGIGLAYGATVSGLCVVSGAVQILTYPVYMANCAVRPFVNLLTPLWFPAVTTFLGACGGLGFKLGK